MARASVLFLAAASSLTGASAGETPALASYLCIGDQATGFAQDAKSKRWVLTHFHDRKYIIKPPTREPGAPSGSFTAAMAVYEFGGDQVMPIAFCDKPPNEVGNLRCEGLGETVLFNTHTLRFLFSFPYGYTEGPNGFFEGATPMMEIGTCSRI
jgi:hypothetical protein